MNTILLIGGYGGFGARLALRLSDPGTHILIAGRNGDKAAAFAATLPNASGVVVDRNGDMATVLASLKPDLAIDAAGPFQGSGYAVPRACMAAGIAYLDLADARDFVANFATLDAEAKAAGVALVTGASSVPALSGAVVRHLTVDMTRAESIDMVISASNRASAGESVSRAALSYAGQPVQVWRGQSWERRQGWGELESVAFATPDGVKLNNRWIALADIPDLTLLPDRVAGRPAVTFKAGTELSFQMTGLWLMSFLVRWGVVDSLTRFASIFIPMIRATKNWGGDRSAMHVIAKGWRGDAPMERRWTLIAEQGDGPEIPTLAAQLLARKLLAGEVAPGARDAGPLLDLHDFQPLFDGLHLHHGVRNSALPPPLYARAMGEAFDRLPPAVRDMHNIISDGGANGEGTVERGRNPLARLIGAIIRLPPAGHYPLHVHFGVQKDQEKWTRNFGGHRFSSVMSQAGPHGVGQVAERFGLMRFVFDLPSDEHGLRMVMRRWTFFGIPMPLFLAPRTEAREGQDEQGRFQFDVDIRFPIIGPVVHYAGWLIRQ